MAADPLKNPTCIPAKSAAPNAVVSPTAGRSTGNPITSACSCMSKSLTHAPPSTRSRCMVTPASCCITPTTSATDIAIDSNAARAMWARVVARDSPMISPLAEGSQSGEPRPVRAGTSTTPPLSATLLASGSTSLAFWMIPRPSRSQLTIAPAMKTEPSNT